ncbi:unnamed protein product [Allacma fusca]|uniref:Uncharacterized protein n=1 Tax=Allacma fusca TaxID=39272 RepID=A0A8J2KND6_9HEXA|nr:unnamed protein product [Allacma fusca]
MQPYGNIILPGESRRRQRFYLSKAKLHRVAQLASFMAGFAIRSVVNLQINKDANDYLLTLYVVTNSLLAVTSCFVILVAMWILPLLKTSELINSEISQILEAQDPARLKYFNLQEFSDKVAKFNNTGGPTLFGLKTYRSTRSTVRLVEIAWISAGTVSVFLFAIDMIAINWVKFRYFTFTGALAGTIIIVLVIIGLGIFGLYFRLHFVKRFRNITKKLHKEEIAWREWPEPLKDLNTSNLTQESSLSDSKDSIFTDYGSIIMV